MTNCPSCGSSNASDAGYCSSCGSFLGDVQDHEDTVIDVTSGEPAIVIDEPERTSDGFASSQFGRVRVYTTQSRSPAVCLIPVAAILLLFTCACVGFFAVIDNIFGI